MPGRKLSPACRRLATDSQINPARLPKLSRPQDDTSRKRTLTNNPAIAITFTKEGQKKFAELTRQHKGKPLAIIVDGKVLCAPTVRDEVSGDKAMISGSFTKEETEKIANGIKAK